MHPVFKAPKLALIPWGEPTYVLVVDLVNLEDENKIPPVNYSDQPPI